MSRSRRGTATRPPGAGRGWAERAATTHHEAAERATAQQAAAAAAPQSERRAARVPLQSPFRVWPMMGGSARETQQSTLRGKQKPKRRTKRSRSSTSSSCSSDSGFYSTRSEQDGTAAADAAGVADAVLTPALPGAPLPADAQEEMLGC